LSRSSLPATDRLLDGGHEVVEFFDPQHTNIPYRRREPRQRLRQVNRRQHAGDGGYLRPAEVDAALLPAETVPLQNVADLQIGVVVGVAVIRPESLNVHAKGDGIHATLLPRCRGKSLAHRGAVRFPQDTDTHGSPSDPK